MSEHKQNTSSASPVKGQMSTGTRRAVWVILLVIFNILVFYAVIKAMVTKVELSYEYALSNKETILR